MKEGKILKIEGLYYVPAITGSVLNEDLFYLDIDTCYNYLKKEIKIVERMGAVSFTLTDLYMGGIGGEADKQNAIEFVLDKEKALEVVEFLLGYIGHG
jgi:hypothetical protein